MKDAPNASLGLINAVPGRDFTRSGPLLEVEVTAGSLGLDQ